MPTTTSSQSNNPETKLTFWFIIISIVVSVALLLGTFFLMGGFKAKTSDTTETATLDSSGKQIVTITAKGGYSPGITTAKANIPTTLIIKTNNTFDCSSAVTIPALNITKSLPFKGETNIEIPAQIAGKEIDIVCSMGMYASKIVFS